MPSFATRLHLLRMAQKIVNPQLDGSGASMKFGPEEGPRFFERYGWTPVDVRSLLKTASRLKRLPFQMRLVALLPESKGRQGSRPWQGICLLKKQSAARLKSLLRLVPFQLVTSNFEELRSEGLVVPRTPQLCGSKSWNGTSCGGTSRRELRASRGCAGSFFRRRRFRARGRG